jgi:arylformamidase
MAVFVDLSHPLEDGQLNFLNDPPLKITACSRLATHGYNLSLVSTSTHQGTHLDVPYHFFDDGRTVDQMALDRFFGPAVLADLCPGASLAAKTPITVAMLQPHEGKFQPGAKVICRTGWDRMFNRPEFFTDYPSFTVEAAKWIAARRIWLLGMDMPTPSIAMEEVHWALLGKGVEMVIVEGLANLDRLPERFTLAAFPLNIKGRDGSPVRAVAILED